MDTSRKITVVRTPKLMKMDTVKSDLGGYWRSFRGRRPSPGETGISASIFYIIKIECPCVCVCVQVWRPDRLTEKAENWHGEPLEHEDEHERG